MMPELWWNQTPGPRKLIRSVADDLGNRMTTWLSGTLPWQHDFHEYVKDRLSEINSDINIEFVDTWELPQDMKPEDLIFSYDSSLRNSYLPSLDLASFLLQRGALSNTIIWLFDLEQSESRQWLELSRKLARQKTGLRIVCEGRDIVNGANKNITCFSAQDVVNEFDILLFAMTALQRNDWNSDTKLYACRLATELSEKEAENTAILINHCQELLLNPAECAANEIALLDSDIAENAIRKAQTLTLMPRLEQERAAFIDSLGDRVEKLLPYTDEYNNLMEKPQELELRHIVYFEGVMMLNLSWEEHERVHFLHTMRNRISHRQLIDGEDAVKLLS